MKRILTIAILIYLTLNSIDLFSQEKEITITGKVISFEESFPIEGASVVVKGTKNATGTQADGTFSLAISPNDKILVVSFNGYAAQEIEITRSRDYEVVLRLFTTPKSAIRLTDATTVPTFANL